jgi:hypothetical protein
MLAYKPLKSVGKECKNYLALKIKKELFYKLLYIVNIQDVCMSEYSCYIYCQ